MSLERYFKSYTKEDDQEYSVEVRRVDDSFTVNVYGKFGDHEPIERTFSPSGPDAEQQVQEWLYKLDEEVRKLLEEREEQSSPLLTATS